jgi:hypothetical protein
MIPSNLLPVTLGQIVATPAALPPHHRPPFQRGDGDDVRVLLLGTGNSGIAYEWPDLFLLVLMVIVKRFVLLYF